MAIIQKQNRALLNKLVLYHHNIVNYGSVIGCESVAHLNDLNPDPVLNNCCTNFLHQEMLNDYLYET
jgi:hypothetical protein